jgi:hypothetical protein
MLRPNYNFLHLPSSKVELIVDAGTRINVGARENVECSTIET